MKASLVKAGCLNIIVKNGIRGIPKTKQHAFKKESHFLYIWFPEN
jgi:hypothetical protein